MTIDVRPDKEDILRKDAWDGHRSLREHASFLLDELLEAKKAAQDNLLLAPDAAVEAAS